MESYSMCSLVIGWKLCTWNCTACALSWLAENSVRGIVQHVLSCDWLKTLSLSSGVIPIVTHVTPSFLLFTKQWCSTYLTSHVFIQPSAGRHLHCFPYLTLWVTLPWTFVYRFLGEPMFSILLSVPLVELLGHVVIFLFNLLRSCQTVSKVMALFCIFPPPVWKDSVSLHPCQQLLLSFYCLSGFEWDSLWFWFAFS